MTFQESIHQKAITHVRRRARASAVRWGERGAAVMQRAGLESDSLGQLLERVRSQARVVVHFHPERLASDGRTVAAGLLESGVYKTQWETGISTGSPSAFIGGERHIWEERLFGGVYELGSASARPRYGALRLLGHPDGPAPRFGSCRFVLAPSVTERCTFTFPGSQVPEAVDQTASVDLLEPVFVPLLESIESNDGGLGVEGLTVESFIKHALRVLNSWEEIAPDASEPRPLGRALDSFVEAQIHGAITLAEHVDGLVADAVFQTAEIADVLHQLCDRWQIELRWHPGYRMRVEDVPNTFRGWQTGRLAARIEPAPEGWLDAAKIGAAANDWESNPEMWPEFTSRDDALTAFRRIWHVLVQRAQPFSS